MVQTSFHVSVVGSGACLQGQAISKASVTSLLVTSRQRPNCAKLTTWPVAAPAAPAPADGSGPQCVSQVPPDLLARMTKLPGVSLFCSSRQKSLVFLPSVVPMNRLMSSMLHCCRALFGEMHGCILATAFKASGHPASTHMPSGLAGVREATSTMLRFVLYAHFCWRLPTTQACIWRFVPAVGELDPASRHSSLAPL